MAVSLFDTDIHESLCRRLLSIYRPPSHESRNRPYFVLASLRRSRTSYQKIPCKKPKPPPAAPSIPMVKSSSSYSPLPPPLPLLPPNDYFPLPLLVRVALQHL